MCAAPAHASGAVRVRVSLNGGADFGSASLPCSRPSPSPKPSPNSSSNPNLGASLHYAYTCDGHAAIVPCVLDEGCGWCGPPDAKDGGACAARGGGGSSDGSGGGDGSGRLRTPPRRHPAKLATGAAQTDCGGAWSEARRIELGHLGDLTHNGSAAPGAPATLPSYHPYHMTSPKLPYGSAAPGAHVLLIAGDYLLITPAMFPACHPHQVRTPSCDSSWTCATRCAAHCTAT